MPPEKKQVPKEEIAQRYKKGESLRKICKDYDTSYSTLYRRIQEWDIERNTDIRKLDLPTEKVISMYEEGMSCSEISDEFECSSTPIENRLRENGIELNGSEFVDIQEEELREAVTESKTVKEIAEKFDCDRSTIDRKLEKYNIDPPKYYNKKATLADINGYQAMQCGVVGKGVLIHRLLAVSEYGFDEVCNNVVHHKNGIRWDNRPSNIEVMDRTEHSILHAEMKT
jgi:DNA invertase Pin-like site-specific DNA recombinase